MLAIGRRSGDGVRLRLGGKDVWVIPVILRGKVRLLFQADREVAITRAELLTDAERATMPTLNRTAREG